ncbi:hypothetical protein K2173_010389 [Erythroxylum novogranatense]|uniref:Pentatricopeptide repeat-containing protein n=1 Tax=Erythroxylum novogranatense TaxID=1862640 RepID=A0AAV8TG25_9ROSI|nr:hypothetical protein K2173_010389 [Erythroxylum novogranatense]
MILHLNPLISPFHFRFFPTHHFHFPPSPLLNSPFPAFSIRANRLGASLSDTPKVELVNEALLARVSAAKDAAEALNIIAQMSQRNSGVVPVPDCCLIISSAIHRNNSDLALSVFYAMRSSFDQVGENGTLVERWKWSRPDVRVYTLLVQALAASLKVSDALRIIDYICRVGVSPGEEVSFGKVVRCPTCMVAVAVAQPQNGIQVASCAKCRYQYELVSGDITSISSEEIRNS